MSSDADHFLLTIQRCVVGGREGPWSEFLTAIDDLARSVYLSERRSDHGLDEFLSWLPGRLFESRKLNTLWLAVDRKVRSQECPTVSQQADYARNYMAAVIRTAIADFHGESRGQEQLADAETLDQVETPPISQLSTLVEDVLAELEPGLRIPFHLKFARHLGPLTDADLDWLSARCGSPPGEIAEAIDQRLDAGRQKTYPLSSAFIAAILGDDADSARAANAVDVNTQKVRAILRRELEKQG